MVHASFWLRLMHALSILCGMGTFHTACRSFFVLPVPLWGFGEAIFSQVHEFSMNRKQETPGNGCQRLPRSCGLFIRDGMGAYSAAFSSAAGLSVTLASAIIRSTTFCTAAESTM